jgi:hypothetical protein
MVKAVVNHGEIRPLEPLPSDWHEGQHLRVEKADERDMSAAEIDRDFVELDALCQSNTLADEEKIEQSLKESRTQAKDHVRRQMGLD